MTRFRNPTALVAALLAAGCGGAETKFEPKQFSDEEKARIQAEDRQVADEESQGSVGKAKPKRR